MTKVLLMLHIFTLMEIYVANLDSALSEEISQ